MTQEGDPNGKRSIELERKGDKKNKEDYQTVLQPSPRRWMKTDGQDHQLRRKDKGF
jgi:hypothetical protein